MSAPTGGFFWLVLNFLHLKHHHQKTGSPSPTNSRGGCGTHSSHLRHANPTSFPYSAILLPSLIPTSCARHGRRPVGFTEPSLCHGGTPYCAGRQSQCVEAKFANHNAASVSPRKHCRRRGPCARAGSPASAFARYTTATCGISRCCALSCAGSRCRCACAAYGRGCGSVCTRRNFIFARGSGQQI